eukprot:3824206-Amphidinium_carterae.1
MSSVCPSETSCCGSCHLSAVKEENFKSLRHSLKRSASVTCQWLQSVITWDKVAILSRRSSKALPCSLCKSGKALATHGPLQTALDSTCLDGLEELRNTHGGTGNCGPTNHSLSTAARMRIVDLGHISQRQCSKPIICSLTHINKQLPCNNFP